MTIGLNANNDGSGSVQTGGSDAIQISATQNVTIPNNQTVVGQIRSNATSTPPTFADSAGTQIGTLCRAWVTWQYTASTLTVLGSFNVTGVTRNSTGNYTINYTSALPNANYAITSIAYGSTYNSSILSAPLTSSAPTLKSTTQTTVLNVNTGGTLTDFYNNNFAIFN